MKHPTDAWIAELRRRAEDNDAYGVESLLECGAKIIPLLDRLADAEKVVAGVNRLQYSEVPQTIDAMFAFIEERGLSVECETFLQFKKGLAPPAVRETMRKIGEIETREDGGR